MNYLTVRPRRSWFATDFDRMFEDFLRAPVFAGESDSGFAPRVNIQESKDDLSLTFELPGMAKENIKVTVVDGILTVSGQRQENKRTDSDRYFRQEIHAGEFSRSFTLPDTVNAEKVSADYKNGLLEIRLAKLEEVKPKEIEVKVS